MWGVRELTYSGVEIWERHRDDFAEQLVGRFDVAQHRLAGHSDEQDFVRERQLRDIFR